MKRNAGKYPVVTKLPKNAKLVKVYAKEQGVDPPAIYNRLKRGKAEFKIVIFAETNFVVPNI